MTDGPDRAELERFLAASGEARSAHDLGALAEGLHGHVHRDAELVTRVAPVLAETAEGGTAACALRALVTANATLGRHAEALTAVERARTLALAAGDRTEAARVLVASMQPLCETGRVEEAIATGEQARDELLEAKETALSARVDLNLGNVHKMRGESARALSHLERVLEVLPEDDPIRPHALNAVGECRHLLDDHEGADQAFREALEALGENAGLAGGVITGNRADVASREGRLQEAIALFTEARRRLESLGAESHVARLVVETAEALEVAGLHQEARAELEAGLERVIAVDMPHESARARLALGRLHIREGRFHQAVERFEEARALYESIDNRRLADRCRLATAEALIAAGRNDQAAVHLEVVRGAERDGYDRLLLDHHESLLHEAEGRLEEAVRFSESARREAESLGIRPLAIDLAARHCRLLRETGAVAEAIRIGLDATRAIEGIRTGFQGERLRAAFLASRLDAHEACVAALLASGSEADLELAFETVERARNRALVERLSRQLEETGASSPDDPTTLRLRRRLNALYAAMARDGFEDQRRLRSGDRQREIDALELQLDRHLIEVEPAITAATSLPDIEEIGSALGPGTVMLEFFVIGDDLAIFTVDVTGLKVEVRTGVLPRLRELIDEFHFQCRRRLRGVPGPGLEQRMVTASHAILRELHDLLLAELDATTLAAERWLIVPYGPLVSIPFHALHDGTSHLIDRVSIATAPSAATAVSRPRPRRRSEGVLVATVADELAPSITVEGDAVAAGYEATGEPLLRLDGAAATTDRVKEALTRVRVAHIACHGRFLAGSPRSSGLRMADRWLTVRDVHDLNEAPEIVVLSGCETGLNPSEGADELHGITRGFSANGSSAVVASLWSVHDAASTGLMKALHERLPALMGSPFGVTEALRGAQLELRESRPHPAFWAAFFSSEACFGTVARNATDEPTRGGDVTCRS